jgi:two-component system, response regulator PdtaR
MVPQPEDQDSPARILVVEDEVLVRNLLAEELREAGFCVIEAAHAEEAMSYLQAGEAVDLVFTDVRMPGSRNGLELARVLRAWHPSLPIILTSGNNPPRGADEIGPFIPKPYDIQRALAVVRALLGSRTPDQQDPSNDNG